MDYQLYKFTAYNTQALFGWGNDDEASEYVDFLNRDRDVNCYSFEEITDDKTIRTYDRGDIGVILSDALEEIATILKD